MYVAFVCAQTLVAVCVCVFTSVAMSEQCFLAVIFMHRYLRMTSADGLCESFRPRGVNRTKVIIVCVCVCV